MSPSGLSASLLGIAAACLLGCAEQEETPSGMHDHTARHGGVVTMAGDLHVEAVAHADGRVRLYLSDVRRRPLPVEDATGTLALELPDGERTIPLVPADDRLEGSGPALGGQDVLVHALLVRGGRSIDLHLRVPVAGSGLAGLPRGCQEPADPPAGVGRRPRCSVRFPRTVRGFAVTPDGSAVMIAVFAHGVSAWRLPAFDPIFALTPIPGADEHPDHAHPVEALAVRPDGREIAVTAKGELLRYSLATGELLGEVSRSPVSFRALAWSADSTRVLASAFYDGAVRVFRAADGTEVARFDVGRHLTAFALAPDGRLVALASELGPITVFDADGGNVLARLDASIPAQALAFGESGLVAARQDGRVELWDVRAGRRVSDGTPGPAVIAVAARAGQGTVASARQDGSIGLHGPDGEERETLVWHRAPVRALAWAGPILLSGDGDGALAVWDLEAN